MIPWDDEGDYDDYGPPSPPTLDVEPTDPEEIGWLYGPDGESILLTIYDRTPIAFGFQPPAAA